MVHSCHRRQTCTRSLVDTLWGWKGVAPPSGLPSCRPYSRVRVLALWIPLYLPVPTVRSGQWVSPLIGLLVTGQSCFMVTFSVTMKHDWPATSKVFVPDWHSLICYSLYYVNVNLCWIWNHPANHSCVSHVVQVVGNSTWLLLCVSHVLFFASTFLMCLFGYALASMLMMLSFMFSPNFSQLSSMSLKTSLRWTTENLHRPFFFLFYIELVAKKRNKFEWKMSQGTRPKCQMTFCKGWYAAALLEYRHLGRRETGDLTSREKKTRVLTTCPGALELWHWMVTLQILLIAEWSQCES